MKCGLLKNVQQNMTQKSDQVTFGRSESISFEVGKNKLDAILTSQEKQNMYLLAAAEEYLQNVSPNLFYRGYE